MASSSKTAYRPSSTFYPLGQHPSPSPPNPTRRPTDLPRAYDEARTPAPSPSSPSSSPDTRTTTTYPDSYPSSPPTESPSNLTRDAHLSTIRTRIGLPPSAPILASHATHHHLTWSGIRVVLREPFAEFFGAFIMILFGNGSVAQVLLSTGSAAPGGNGFGSYQSINWGWVFSSFSPFPLSYLFPPCNKFHLDFPHFLSTYLNPQI